MIFSAAPELAGIVRPGVLWLVGATIAGRDARLDASLAGVEARMGGEGSGGVRLQPEVARQAEEVRAMYRCVGLDPTRRRPSSEALLRRVRRGEPLPRINAMVDVCNWCSLEFQLPYGLYDASRIEGRVSLRLGREGEAYAGIRKDEVHVGGRITLADAAGPFGNPTSDSARTMVTTETTSVLLVVYAPASVGAARLAQVLDLTSARVREHTGAREVSRLPAAG